MRRAMRMLGREAHAWAKQGQLMLMRSRKDDGRDLGARAVAFVHGYGAGGGVFEPLRELIEERLGVATIELSYKSSESFDAIVTRFAERLDSIGQGRRLDMVGHSLGGLISRWYVQEMGGARHVDRVVTMATPHAGTHSARIALGPLKHVLLPGSHVVRRLAASRAKAAHVQHTALVAGSDLMVTPPASAAAIEDASVRWFDELGHNAMLYDEGVHEAIAHALAQPIKSPEP